MGQELGRRVCGGFAPWRDVTARRREEIAAIVERMPAGQRGGLVAALRAFTDAGREPLVGAPVRDAIPLGWD